MNQGILHEGGLFEYPTLEEHKAAARQAIYDKKIEATRQAVARLAAARDIEEDLSKLKVLELRNRCNALRIAWKGCMKPELNKLLKAHRTYSNMVVGELHHVRVG